MIFSPGICHKTEESFQAVVILFLTKIVKIQ